MHQAVTPESQRRSDRVAAAILLVYIVLGSLYSVASPLLEPSDEHNHYPFVQHLATGGGLPVQRAGEQTLWGQEGSQPPLYYAVSALLTSWIPTTDMLDLLYRNPHDQRGVPGATENANMYIHTDREGFPWRGTALAMHLIRLFSVLLGAGTVLCTYLIARALFPERPAIALTAMAINAFIPMFVFISASVNNDNLVIFLSSLALVLLIRVVQRGAAPIQLAALGIVIGLAALSKLSALGLLPLACLALLLRRDRRRESPPVRSILRWFGECALVAIPAVVVAGWWYLRNWQLYGDPTGLNAMLSIAGGRISPGSFAALLAESQGFLYSFWGVLGGFNVLLRPTWAYALLNTIVLLALVGLAAWVWQSWRRGTPVPWRELWLLAAWIGIEAVALLRWTWLTPASQGRLMFAALSPISLFLALGLLGWLPPRRQRYAAWAIAGLLFLLVASTPFAAILPAYAAEPILTEADVPVSAQRFDVDYGGAMRLLAFDVPQGPIKPGSDVPVTLYWKMLKPVSEDLSMAVHVFGWHQSLGQVDTYPGGGTRPTSLLSPGQVLADRYVVHLREDAKGPAPAWISAGLYRLSTMERLPATDAGGQPVIFPVLTKLTLEPPTQTLQGAYPLDANLSDRVRLIGYDLAGDPIRPGDEITTTLYWQSTAPLETDYTVFVHVRDESGQTVAQADAPPMQGFYPTSAWKPGEILDDTQRIYLPNDLEPGHYRIIAGLYDPKSGQRLPVLDAASREAGNEVLVAEVQVAPP